MKNPSRKYIDLILKASSKWANWDPPIPIKVGDYGALDKETGKFERDGNIYDDESTSHLAAKYQPQTADPEDEWIVSSKGVKRHELVLEPQLGISGVCQASIKGRWEFGSKRGALLIMSGPRISYIPRNTLLELLADVPTLKDKSLVTEVVSCPAYSLYLSTANKDVIDVALMSSGNQAVTAGGNFEASWWTQNTTGVFRHVCDSSGSHRYTPLYLLKEIRRKRFRLRDSPAPNFEGDDLWIETQQPWNHLDDDGNEQDFEDTIFG